MSRRAISGHGSGAASHWRWCKGAGLVTARRSGQRSRTGSSRHGFAPRFSMTRKGSAGMADLTELTASPLGGLLPGAFPDGTVSIEEMRFAQQIGVRLRSRVPAYLAGLPLPLEPNRAAIMRTVRVLWLRPGVWLGRDEGLVTAPEGAVPELPTRIARAVADLRAAVTDLSASRIIIEIAGS